MDRAITNLMRIGRLTLRDAVRTATANPAQLLGLPGRMKGLAVGERADLVLFRLSPAIEIEAVYLDGEHTLVSRPESGWNPAADW
jgi:N-acetylglucosamine-6-phosphate deacetylase